MLTESRFSVSTTAELGDALLTLVRHEVMKATPEHESRRRLEVFVLRAETLVARLTERQETLEREFGLLDRQLAFLRYQIKELIDGDLGLDERLTLLVEQTDRWFTETTADFRRLKVEAGVEIQYQKALHTAQEGLYTAAVARITALEARTLPARWRRLVDRLSALWRPRAVR